MLNPVVNYRWLLDGVPGGYQWLNGEGLHAHDVTDAADFRMTCARRAARRGPRTPSCTRCSPTGSRSRSTVRHRTGRSRRTGTTRSSATDPRRPYQYYGGDLDGITAHLDHIAATGANTVYLTPVFPARSNHRYDASTFDEVDPLLGGDEALARLSDAVHARGMRLIGDLTTNHCGDGHEWFQTAIADASSPEAGYFTFTDHPHRYVCWFGHPSLPKFDHRDPGLRRRLYEGPGSVVARWLGPRGLDGWRIDVANMTARLGTTDLNRMVATTHPGDDGRGEPGVSAARRAQPRRLRRPARRRLARRDELRRLHPTRSGSG